MGQPFTPLICHPSVRLMRKISTPREAEYYQVVKPAPEFPFSACLSVDRATYRPKLELAKGFEPPTL
jgi:hypothetical protein